MDEYLSVSLLILIALFSINAVSLWVDANSEVLHLGLSDDTVFATFQQSSSDASSSYTTSTEPSISKKASASFELTWDKIIVTIAMLLVGWTVLLTAILTPIPGGTVFLMFVLPFLAVTQAIAGAVILYRIAAVARGILP